MNSEIPAPAIAVNYSPDEIIVYGVNLRINKYGATLPFGQDHVVTINGGLSNPPKPVPGKPDLTPPTVIALVYGYAFEGACYRCDKPKLLLFNAAVEQNAVGCGFDLPGYKQWRITKRDVVAELAMKVDDADAILLMANLPGNRTPNTYGNNMKLGHRSGRLGRHDDS